MAEPVSDTISVENGTIGLFYLSGMQQADLAIKVDGGTATLQRKIDELTGFLTVRFESGDAIFTEGRSMIIEGAGTWQIIGTNTPDVKGTFRHR